MNRPFLTRGQSLSNYREKVAMRSLLLVATTNPTRVDPIIVRQPKTHCYFLAMAPYKFSRMRHQLLFCRLNLRLPFIGISLVLLAAA